MFNKIWTTGHIVFTEKTSGKIQPIFNTEKWKIYEMPKEVVKNFDKSNGDIIFWK